MEKSCFLYNCGSRIENCHSTFKCLDWSILICTSKIFIFLDLGCRLIFKLNLVSFIFIILPKESISKIMKNGSLLFFHKKVLFVLEIFNFLFFPSLHSFHSFKGSHETGIINALWIGLLKLANVFFGITLRNHFVSERIFRWGTHLSMSLFPSTRLAPYLRNHTSCDHSFWYRCVKWWYLQAFFSFF